MKNIEILQVIPSQYIILGVIIVALVLCFLAVFIVVSNKKKRKLSSGNEFAEKIISSLGGAENINNAKLQRRRLSVEVHDLNAIKPKEMRTLKLGAIITKNNVKMLVKDNPKEVYKHIIKRRKEVK